MSMDGISRRGASPSPTSAYTHPQKKCAHWIHVSSINTVSNGLADSRVSRFGIMFCRKYGAILRTDTTYSLFFIVGERRVGVV
jgi:hypothetical protein